MGMVLGTYGRHKIGASMVFVGKPEEKGSVGKE